MRFDHPDYPAVLHFGGVVMRLVRESRWSRVYEHPNQKKRLLISRFDDRSATITAGELADGWESWTETERIDFCQSSSWLSAQDDFPEMLRFIVQRGGASDVAMIASSVARCLPREEAFGALVKALEEADVPEGANIAQAVALTRHPRAEGTLRAYLDRAWRDPGLSDDDPFLNWVAYTATCCIEYLLTLGVAPHELESYARELATHACAGNRDSCRRFLGKYYDFGEPDPPPDEPDSAA